MGRCSLSRRAERSSGLGELRTAGHWREVIPVRSTAALDATVEELVAGEAADGRMDLERTLEFLGSDIVATTMRVDSGGGLKGALLDRRLIS